MVSLKPNYKNVVSLGNSLDQGAVTVLENLRVLP